MTEAEEGLSNCLSTYKARRPDHPKDSPWVSTLEGYYLVKEPCLDVPLEVRINV